MSETKKKVRVMENKIGSLQNEIRELEREKYRLLKAEEEKLDYVLSFEVKQEHLALLKQMYVEWWDCEFGAPCINPKRPYGNSDVFTDIAEILKLKKSKENWDKEQEDWTDEAIDLMTKFHKEMKIVLQIVVQNNSVQIGKHERTDAYSASWKLVKE